MKFLYYAHSKKTYGTRKEKKELRLIQKQFPDYRIINPSTLIFISQDESGIMEECKSIARQAAVVVASEYDNHIGRGVFEELLETKRKKYLLRKKNFIENFKIKIVDIDDWAVRYAKCEEE